MDTNFSKLIKDLRRIEWTNAEIAMKIGCSPVYVGQLANGNRKTPSYEIGRKLVELHKRRLK